MLNTFPGFLPSLPLTGKAGVNRSPETLSVAYHQPGTLTGSQFLKSVRDLSRRPVVECLDELFFTHRMARQHIRLHGGPGPADWVAPGTHLKM